MWRSRLWSTLHRHVRHKRLNLFQATRTYKGLSDDDLRFALRSAACMPRKTTEPALTAFCGHNT